MPTKHLFVVIHIRNKGEVGTQTCLSPQVIFFTDRSKAVLLLWIFFAVVFCVYHAVLSVHSSLVVTCWERADLLDLLYVMFSCAFFITFPCGVLDQVWYLIVLLPDLCLVPYFANNTAL